MSEKLGLTVYVQKLTNQAIFDLPADTVVVAMADGEQISAQRIIKSVEVPSIGRTIDFDGYILPYAKEFLTSVEFVASAQALGIENVLVIRKTENENPKNSRGEISPEQNQGVTC